MRWFVQRGMGQVWGRSCGELVPERTCLTNTMDFFKE
jgi:hypothetical protein